MLRFENELRKEYLIFSFVDLSGLLELSRLCAAEKERSQGICTSWLGSTHISGHWYDSAFLTFCQSATKQSLRSYDADQASRHGVTRCRYTSNRSRYLALI